MPPLSFRALTKENAVTLGKTKEIPIQVNRMCAAVYHKAGCITSNRFTLNVN